jgi:uncharacterized protein YecE (DUF72 family)
MKKGISAAGRFNYLYSDEELQELAEPVKQLARRTKEVHAMFNNCYEDKAVQNAKRCMELLGVS